MNGIRNYLIKHGERQFLKAIEHERRTVSTKKALDHIPKKSC